VGLLAWPGCSRSAPRRSHGSAPGEAPAWLRSDAPPGPLAATDTRPSARAPPTGSPRARRWPSRAASPASRSLRAPPDASPGTRRPTRRASSSLPDRRAPSRASVFSSAFSASARLTNPADLWPRRTAPLQPVAVRPQRLTIHSPRLQLEHLALLNHPEPPRSTTDRGISSSQAVTTPFRTEGAITTAGPLRHEADSPHPDLIKHE
jgi:hypothetical protein